MKPIRSNGWFGLLVIFLSSAYGAVSPVTDEARGKIEEALPGQAVVQPMQLRKLLIFTRNVGYGGHPSIFYANEAFTRMGKKTGAFETVISDDPQAFERDSLKKFDAVFFNNTVGNCFTNRELRRNLAEFVYGGGGLMGVHGTTVAFTQWPGAVEDWPEFGYMIGARGANHKDSTETVWIKIDDPQSPLTSLFDPKGFEFRDEFFRVHDLYSRQRLRVLLTIDTDKTDVNQGDPRGNCVRADNDYALAWIQSYGRGRTFYSTIAHNPYVFWNREMLQFYLGAIQFVLGDLPAPTTPSAKLNPATRAQEKLGWRLGVEAYTFHKFTFVETIEKTAQLGLPYVGGLSFQIASKDTGRTFDPALSDVELESIRLSLATNGVRLLTYYIHDIPADEGGCRKVFEFGKKMGIETFMTEPKPDALDIVEKCADEYGINVALHNHDAKMSPQYWNPEGILKACEGRSKRMGACGDLGYWMRAGIDPVQAVRALKDRLITVQVHDLDKSGPDGQDVPWGTGVGKTTDFFEELRKLNIRPTMIGLEYSRDWLESMPKVAQCKEYFDGLTLRLTGQKD